MSKTQAISAPSDGKARSTKAKKSAPTKIATAVAVVAPAAKPRAKRAPACAIVAEQKIPSTSVASPNTSPRVSKQDRLAALLLRDQGATLDQIISAMGWLPHTTRAALTGLRKKGYAIDSDKVDGVRTYRSVSQR